MVNQIKNAFSFSWSRIFPPRMAVSTPVMPRLMETFRYWQEMTQEIIIAG
jgi:hypothetical protein